MSPTRAADPWIRDLLYVELRATHGAAWESVVRQASGRQTADATYTHMHSADTLNPIAYLDYSQVLELIAEHWETFEYALLTRRAWEGRQEELKRIRHRIGHMRKPHPDDLGRLEQTLRDLERGAFIAQASYNHSHVPDPDDHDDAVTRGWIREEHEDARRLVNHARRQYETNITVRSSTRPWVQGKRGGHGPGRLWHADFFSAGRSIDASRLWFDTGLDRVRGLIVHLLCHSPNHVSFTFSGADDDGAVADAIGNAFDAFLSNARHGEPVPLGDRFEAWQRSARDLDYRVLVDSGWMIVDTTTVPISIFGSGGSVRANPGW